MKTKTISMVILTALSLLLKPHYADVPALPLHEALHDTPTSQRQALQLKAHELSLIHATVQRSQGISTRKLFAEYGFDLGHELDLQLLLAEHTAVPIATWQLEHVKQESRLNRFKSELAAEKLYIDALEAQQAVTLETMRLTLESQKFEQSTAAYQTGKLTELDYKKQKLALRRQANTLKTAEQKLKTTQSKLNHLTGDTVLIIAPALNTRPLPSKDYLYRQLQFRFELQSLLLKNNMNKATMDIYKMKQFLSYPANERFYVLTQADYALNEHLIQEKRNAIQLEVDLALLDIETAFNTQAQLADQLTLQKRKLDANHVKLKKGLITKEDYQQLTIHYTDLEHHHNLALAHYNLLRKQLYYATTTGPAYEGGL